MLNTIKNASFWVKLRRFSIKKRLSYSFAFLVICPIVIIMLVTHMIFGKAMKNNLRSYSEQLMAQLAANMAGEINWLVDCAMELAYSESFQNMVQYQEKVDWDFLNNYRLVCNMSSAKFNYKNYIQQVNYIGQTDRVYTLYGNNAAILQENIKAILEETKDRMSPYFWYFTGSNEEDEPALYLLCRVRKLTVGTVSGTMVISLGSEFLSDFYENMSESLGEGTRIFTVNDTGVLVSGNRDAYRYLEPESLSEAFRQENSNSRNFRVQDDKYMGVWSGIGNTGWKVIALIPYAYINSVSNSTSILILCIGFVVLLLALIIAAILNTSIVMPLNRILDYTLLLRQGEFRRQIVDDGEDEIRQLADSFNCATDEINRLMLSVKEQSEQKARLEFDALQAQINPHFLANTLNTISYLAQLRGMQNIENIAKALTNILMVSMGKESKIIPLEKEISYVKDYLLIQSYRYTNLYQVDFDIQGELLGYKIPKFILQPIVENAIVHGVSNLRDGYGHIRVSGYLCGEEIHLAVVDNGPGIPVKVQKELLNGNREKGMCGLGVRSVDQRLKLLFGDTYGLFISSRSGFTKVELIFPVEGGSGIEDSSDCG
ncbi:sensor histidine kinase [Diplocloster modestus]|uniref:Histidine kinase n=1 Tax=Diplocloster modestus TaxID=2850322 RepID=A0ABS6KBH0_9FIRM|nr:sensor histidine kinase [Diplocloster modestus]MBU9727862.1 histidine kinase [Diplocloster modestus]